MALAPSLGWLFVGRVISGITSASISTAYAYIADVTAAGEARGAFGLLGVAFGAGFVIGPALGGIAGRASIRVCRSGSRRVSSLANSLYGLLHLARVAAARRRAWRLRWKRANPLSALKLLGSNRILAGLSLAIRN